MCYRAEWNIDLSSYSTLTSFNSGQSNTNMTLECQDTVSVLCINIACNWYQWKKLSVHLVKQTIIYANTISSISESNALLSKQILWLLHQIASSSPTGCINELATLIQLITATSKNHSLFIITYYRPFKTSKSYLYMAQLNLTQRISIFRLIRTLFLCRTHESDPSQMPLIAYPFFKLLLNTDRTAVSLSSIPISSKQELPHDIRCFYSLTANPTSICTKLYESTLLQLLRHKVKPRSQTWAFLTYIII